MLLLALMSTLLAQEPALPSAETAIERGRLLIRDLYEEKALVVLEPYLDDAELPPPLRARALVYAGIAQMNLGDEATAKGTFTRALDVDIGAVLPEWVSRKVRVAFDAELERAMAARRPAPQPKPTTRAQRYAWFGPTLLGTAAFSAAFSVLGFLQWSAAWSAHKMAPIGTDGERIYQAGVPWHIEGWITAGLAAALLIAAALWWLLP